VVLVPEPTSIENVYRFVKAAFFRRLSFLSEEMPIKTLVEQAMGQRGAARTAYQILSEAQRIAPEHAPRLQQVMRSFRPALVVNQVRSREDRDVGPAVVAAWKKYFGLDMDFLGGLTYDDEVWRAIRRRKPLLIDRPGCAIASNFSRVVDELLLLDGLQRVAAP
jgi:flagellar biosynthesis protein FlhG